jgi:hypothetical protein
MIQRIQTLYLLLIVILSSITAFLPVAGLINSATNIKYILDFNGISTAEAHVVNTWALSVISLIIPAIALLTVFLYKKRLLQIRLSIFNTIIMAGYYGLLFIYLWQASKQLNADWYLEIISAFPLICIILNFMSIRSIGKDEALVKSLNRIR